jgi:environmental stress-induced protein Ves
LTQRLLPLPAAQRSAVPWANGGGLTREVAIRGPNVGFEWRVSLAEVATSGPFSHFPGLDRTIVLLSPGRLILDFEVDSVELVRLEPFRFPGDVPVKGRLGGAPTTDLNVMADRTKWEASVSVVDLRKRTNLPDVPDRVVLALSGAVGVTGSSWSGQLRELDAVCGGEGLELRPIGATRVAVIDFWPRPEPEIDWSG